MFGGAVPDALTRSSACSRRCTTTTATWRSRALVAAPGPTVDYPTRLGCAPSPGVLDGVALDRLGTASSPGSGPTRPSRHRLRRPLGRQRVATPSSRRAAAKVSRSARARPGPRRRHGRAAHHLVEHAPWGAVTVTDGEEGKPFRRRLDSPATRRPAGVRPLVGVEPVDIGVGGSIPFIASSCRGLPDAAILVTGVEDPDGRAHGANESVHLGELEKVVLAEALLLERLARS